MHSLERSFAGRWASLLPPGSAMPPNHQKCAKMGHSVAYFQQQWLGKWPLARTGTPAQPALLFLTQHQAERWRVSFLFLFRERWTKENQINLQKPSALRQGSPREKKKKGNPAYFCTALGWTVQAVNFSANQENTAVTLPMLFYQEKKCNQRQKGAVWLRGSSWKEQGKIKWNNIFSFSKSPRIFFQHFLNK